MDGGTDDLARLRDRVRDAAKRAHDAVRARQNEDGSWTGRNQTGAFGTALTLAYERYLGALSERDAREGVRFLRSKQLDDGSVAPWPGASAGSVDATALFIAGMRAAQVPFDDPALARAQAWIDARGGFAAANIVSQTALAVAGVYDPERLPAMPMAFELVPFSRELLARVFGLNTLMPLHSMPGLIYGLRNGPPSWFTDPIARASAARVIEYFSARQDPSGGWIGVPFVTLSVAACMVALGVSRSDRRVVRALEFVASTKCFAEDGLDAVPIVSATWDTAQLIRGLLVTGVSPHDPMIERAVQFLLRYQTTRPSPRDWQTPPRHAPAAGGWPFEVGNELNPDIDSTQEVLGALALVAKLRGTAEPALDEAIRRGLDWLLSMQNPDGGFAAFSYGKPSQQPGPLFLPRPEPPAGVRWFARAVQGVSQLTDSIVQLGDPSTADVTARTLWTLGTAGLLRTDPAVERAASFLSWQRYTGNGLFWGWWAVNYLPTAAYAITGHLASGGVPNEPWIAHVLRTYRALQHDDGGWSDSTDSYVDPSRTGEGPSMRSITGFVLWAYCSAGAAHDEAVRRGFEYLLATQREDGRWLDERAQGVLVPNFGYYTNDTFSTYTALEACGAFLRATGGL